MIFGQDNFNYTRHHVCDKNKSNSDVIHLRKENTFVFNDITENGLRSLTCIAQLFTL